MITISTRDYTTKQLKFLVNGLRVTQSELLDSIECRYDPFCTTECKGYAICTDVSNTLYYLNRKIKERESLELHRDTQESK